MRPKVGMASGPRWRKGIIDGEVSRLQKYTRALSTARMPPHTGSHFSSSSRPKLRKLYSTSTPGAENESETNPDPKGDPFGGRKVAGKDWQNFHQEEQQGDRDSQPSHNPNRCSLLDHPERETRREPTQGRGHRTDFGYGNE